MLDDPAAHHLDPDSPESRLRAQRLRELGLGRPDPRFDALARRVAEAARDLPGTPVATHGFVNFLSDRQRFAGLYFPDGPKPDTTLTAVAADPAREWDLQRGICPYVVNRRKALPLDDVNAYPPFANDPVTEMFGVMSYFGAPVMDDETNLVLGTVCIVDTVTHQWGRAGLNLIKAAAVEVTREIRTRG